MKQLLDGFDTLSQQENQYIDIMKSIVVCFSLNSNKWFLKNPFIYPLFYLEYSIYKEG